MLKILKIANPLGKSIEVAMLRGYDMKDTRQAYDVCSEGVIIPEGDFEGLTKCEIESLEDYTIPIFEEIKGTTPYQEQE